MRIDKYPVSSMAFTILVTAVTISSISGKQIKVNNCSWQAATLPTVALFQSTETLFLTGVGKFSGIMDNLDLVLDVGKSFTFGISDNNAGVASVIATYNVI